MPPMTRDRVKQNIDRAKGHVDKLQEYMIAIGNPFIDVGLAISQDKGQWPEQYIKIIDCVDATITMITLIRDMLEALDKEI